MSIDVDIVPERRNSGLERPTRWKFFFSYNGFERGVEGSWSKRWRVFTGMSSQDGLLPLQKSRDKKAFKRLFNYFGPRIKGFCQNNGSTSDRADEVVQEAFVNIWRKANLFDPKKASAGAWIFAIARNSRIDLIRKENRPEADTTDPFFEQNEPENPLAVLETERKSKLLRDFVRDLPAEQQQVLKLAFLRKSHILR